MLNEFLKLWSHKLENLDMSNSAMNSEALKPLCNFSIDNFTTKELNFRNNQLFAPHEAKLKMSDIPMRNIEHETKVRVNLAKNEINSEAAQTYVTLFQYVVKYLDLSGNDIQINGERIEKFLQPDATLISFDLGRSILKDKNLEKITDLITQNKVTYLRKINAAFTKESIEQFFEAVKKSSSQSTGNFSWKYEDEEINKSLCERLKKALIKNQQLLSRLSDPQSLKAATEALEENISCIKSLEEYKNDLLLRSNDRQGKILVDSVYEEGDIGDGMMPLDCFKY